jgi:adenylate cyclase, class 2
MQEIEVKIIGIDVERLIARLEELGAEPIFSGVVRCLHFDFPDKSLRKSGRLMRLRRWEAEEGFKDKFEICTKGPKEIVEGCKSREELETYVEDADKFEALMNRLGFETTLNNDKHRRSYVLGGAHIDIDAYPGVPVYMEIEAMTSHIVDETIEELELQACERSTETANEMFKRLYPEVDFDNLKI